MKILSVLILAVVLGLSGCSTAKDFLGETKASYSKEAGFSWVSNKNQQDLEASGQINPDGTANFSIKTTSVTPDSVIAAVSQIQLKMTAILEKLTDMAQAAATKGGSNVPNISPAPGGVSVLGQ